MEVCNEIEEWIEEQVEKPVTTWVEETQERCEEEDCNLWLLCLNKLVCFLVTVVVAVVTFVVSIVLKLVTRIVCFLVTIVFDLLIAVVRGVVQIVVGIFTFNWAVILDGLFTLVGGLFGFIGALIRIIFLGVVVAWIVDSVSEWRLKNHVRDLLEEKFRGESLDAIEDALSVDHGYFGWRVNGRGVRLFVDSHFKNDEASEVPDLLALHEAGSINLFELAGFDFDSYLNRSRYYPVLKPDGPFITGGGGILYSDGFTGLSRDQLQRYIDSRGTEGPVFLIFSMSHKLFSSRLGIASEKLRNLGILVDWDTESVHISKVEHIIQAGTNCCQPSVQADFLHDVLNRPVKILDDNDAVTDENEALMSLCTPLSVAVFRYENIDLNGLGSVLKRHTCFACADCSNDPPGLGPSNAWGSTFKDRLPEFVWRYVAAHELGHSYSLCHVPSGIERIMYTGRSSKFMSWSTLLDYLYLYGEPNFNLAEAFQAWDYIVANVPQSCLMSREHG